MGRPTDSCWIVQELDPATQFGKRRCVFWSDELGRYILMRPLLGGSADKTRPLMLGQAVYDRDRDAENALRIWKDGGAWPEPPGARHPGEVRVVEIRVTAYEPEYEEE